MRTVASGNLTDASSVLDDWGLRRKESGQVSTKRNMIRKILRQAASNRNASTCQRGKDRP